MRRPVIVLAVFALTAHACSLGGEASSSISPTPTLRPTTATGPVDNGPAVSVERIVLARGESGTLLSGGAELGEPSSYVLEAAEGQSLILALSSDDDNATYDVISPSGALLATEQTEGATAVRERGDHRLVVSSTRGHATYDLDVRVYPAERVRFVHGAIGTTVSGVVAAGEQAVHILGTPAGLTIQVMVSSVEDNVVFDVYPPIGPRLVADATIFDLATIERGDYLVVIGATSGKATYDLKVTAVP